MARTPSAPRKRRTREHVIADLAVNYVERQALLCGHSVERWLHDYGLDLVLWTFGAGGRAEAGAIYLQVKATDQIRFAGGGRFVTCRIERADLLRWLAEPMPVILCLYDAHAERGYWTYVQAALSGGRAFRLPRSAARVTIRIPVSQGIDPAAIQRFRQFREDVLEQRKGVIHRD